MRAAGFLGGLLERLAVLAFAAVIVALIVGASLALGYLVGKLLL